MARSVGAIAHVASSFLCSSLQRALWDVGRDLMRHSARRIKESAFKGAIQRCDPDILGDDLEKLKLWVRFFPFMSHMTY